MALQPISVSSTATMGADARQLRPRHSEPAKVSVQTQGGVRAHVGAPVVVVQLGGQALGLARSPLTPNPNAARVAVDDDLEGSAVGPTATNAALLGALDSNARQTRGLTPGTEPEAAPDQSPNGSPSGLFRSSGMTSAPSPLASDGLDDGLDWLFPGSPSSRALDSPFARPDAQLATELTVRELPARTGRADEPLPRAVLAGYVSRVQLEYEEGPDVRPDVVEADVPIDVTPVPGDPAATLRKMEVIRRAVSSGSPSSSARDAAAEAAQLALRARAQLAAERYAEAQEYQAKSPAVE